MRVLKYSWTSVAPERLGEGRPDEKAGRERSASGKATARDEAGTLSSRLARYAASSSGPAAAPATASEPRWSIAVV